MLMKQKIRSVQLGKKFMKKRKCISSNYLFPISLIFLKGNSHLNQSKPELYYNNMSKSKDQKQSKAKAPNAFELNPGMMQALATITPADFPKLLLGNPEFVPQNFRKQIMKSIKSTVTLGVSDLIAGIALNMVVTRVLPSFLVLKGYQRIPLRLCILALPFAATYPKLSQHYSHIDELIDNQYIKMQRFRKTGNIEQYFN